MDQTIRCWDVRPFVVGEQRCVKIFQGASHHYDKNLLKVCWSQDGSKISAGSSDKFTYIWDTTSRKILNKLGGHKGSVYFSFVLLNIFLGK
jgi:Prp8 binding protein